MDIWSFCQIIEIKVNENTISLKAIVECFWKAYTHLKKEMYYTYMYTYEVNLEGNANWPLASDQSIAGLYAEGVQTKPTPPPPRPKRSTKKVHRSDQKHMQLEQWHSYSMCITAFSQKHQWVCSSLLKDPKSLPQLGKEPSQPKSYVWAWYNSIQ